MGIVERKEYSLSTYACWLLNTRRTARLARSKSCTVPLSHPATRSRPSCLNLGEWATSRNLAIERRTAAARGSTTITAGPEAAATSYGASGEKDRSVTGAGCGTRTEDALLNVQRRTSAPTRAGPAGPRGTATGTKSTSIREVDPRTPKRQPTVMGTPCRSGWGEGERVAPLVTSHRSHLVRLIAWFYRLDSKHLGGACGDAHAHPAVGRGYDLKC
jgi:hypothetical protein